MELFIAALIPFLTASVGFWAYLKNRFKVDDTDRKIMVNLLFGLAQSQLIMQGMKYIERGWISTEEYEDLRRYLYEPYRDLGGNGTVERIMHAVERLPFSEEPMFKTEVYRDIPIRETDETGIPHSKPIPVEHDRRKREHP
jgi:hypothetical protein